MAIYDIIILEEITIELEKTASEIARENINADFKKNIGMSYDEFKRLDHEEQERLFRAHRSKKRQSSTVTVVLGSGEHSLIARAKRGKRVFITTGDESVMARVGVDLEKSRKAVDKKLDELTYGKVGAKVMSLARRIPGHQKRR